MHPAILVILAGACSAVATGMVLRYARHRLIDPVTARSSHSVPTPRGGGLGLVAGLLPAWMIAGLGGLDLAIAMLAASISGMAALGWWDDHADLPATRRLAMQFLLASLGLWATGIPSVLHLGPWTMVVPVWLVGGLALVGAVWMVNLCNFMDGIDGIAGGQGCVAGAAAGALLGLVGADPRLAGLGWAAAGACAGFLWWNRPPARIFMGDVGSTALGLGFAMLVLTQLRAGIPLDLALLPLAPFVLDATTTLVRRTWRRERLSQAHRSHLYQRLARHWGSHLPVTGVYLALAILGAVGAHLTMAGVLPHLVATVTILVQFGALSAYGRITAAA